MEKIRKNFMDAVTEQNNQRKTLTENLAVAYETSGKELLDFNFKLSQFRAMSESDIENRFAKVFYEDPMLAVKYVFYVGDIRGGLGERKVFRACMNWLAKNQLEIALAVLELVPEYTRWDNLINLLYVDDLDINAKVMEIVGTQLASDICNMAKGESISLLAKWMPSENASSVNTRELARKIIKHTEMTPRNYRKTLSALRKYLDVVEVKVSANEWGKINYESVPSQANVKYKDAFMKHDEDRRVKYLESLKKGEAKINASVSQPYEIVRAYLEHANGWWNIDIAKYDETLEQMWKALPDLTVENTLVVRDGSGSMTCSAGGMNKTSCLDVATSLAIYCAEHNSEAWRDKFITFSSNPSIVDLSNCKTLRDKLNRTYAENDCSNTNIEATMRLILETAISNEFTQEDMPANVVIISDMQFDGGRSWGFNWNKTLFENIAEEYAEHGYKLPRLVFWNVAARNSDTIPMQNNELGLVLCSGLSIGNVRMIMSGEINPYKVLCEQINSERYDPIEERITEFV